MGMPEGKWEWEGDVDTDCSCLDAIQSSQRRVQWLFVLNMEMFLLCLEKLRNLFIP
jgi:hypothetical protein